MSKRQFKAESKKLLDLMINSIYTNKEIFLRELISNASDALDKLYYESLTNKKLKVDKKKLFIKLKIDKEKRLLTIEDNGIGMTESELSENLGTIAKSGSLAFKEGLTKEDKINIIGQFGVGFYSSFMVADKVCVESKKTGCDAYKWVSKGASGYEIEKIDKSDVGTKITLHIKENTEVIKNEAEIEEVKTKAEELLEKIENKTILNAGLDGKKLGALFIASKIFRLNIIDLITDAKNSKKVEELLEKSSIGLMMKNMADTMNMYRTSNEGVIQLDSMYRAVHDKSKAALQPWFANQHLNTKGKAHELLSELEKNENSMGVLIVDASVATNSKTNKLGDFVLYSGIGTKLSRDTSEIYIEDDSRNDFAKLISTPIKFNLDSFDNLAKDLEEKKKESGEILKHMP